MYRCPEFLQLRCSLIAEGFDVESREDMLAAFLEWDDVRKPKCE